MRLVAKNPGALLAAVVDLKAAFEADATDSRWYSAIPSAVGLAGAQAIYAYGLGTLSAALDRLPGLRDSRTTAALRGLIALLRDDVELVP